METDILFELLLYIDTLENEERRKERDSDKRTRESRNKIDTYIACTNLIVSYYNQRLNIEERFGKMNGKRKI